MQDLIKKIRTYLNLSQAEFAEQLNVSFATVNRWENGRALPNKLAQSRLYRFCREKKVPVYEMTLQRIEETVQGIQLPENRVLLFHGSKSGIDGPIEPKSRKYCDFGRGFYMSTDSRQALTLVCDFEDARFYILSMDLQGLDVLTVPANMDWAMLVAYHRGRMEPAQGTPLHEKYRSMMRGKDLVIGSIADDRMFYVIDNFFLGNITDAALVGSLSALQLGKQYVAISQKACDAVRIEKEVPLSYLERQFIKDAAEVNRDAGIALAKETCKNYRREGLYFDEILQSAKSGGQG